jgi:pimeloyl-ACP methyl ester carboxylesterase
MIATTPICCLLHCPGGGVTLDPTRHDWRRPAFGFGIAPLRRRRPTFPGEIVPTPRSWVEKAYPTLTYFNKVDKGGHFAAWEEPELFATEIRAAFQTPR